MSINANRKRILLASDSGQYGGMEMRMIAEAKQLADQGHDVSVAAPPFPGHDSFARELAGIDVAFTPFVPQPIFTNWRKRHVAWMLAELVQWRRFGKFGAELAHVFFSWTDQGLDSLWLASRCGIPTVLSIHNTFPQAEFPPWHRRQLRHAFATVRGLYGVSAGAVDAFLGIFGDFVPRDAHSTTLYNFVDTDRFIPSESRRRETRQMLGLEPDVPLIGSVGRLDDQKKPLDLIEVFACVREQIPNVRLLLVGEGPLERAVRERIGVLDCGDAVTLLKFQEKIGEIYPALDVHLLLSRNEGFGIVTAEALACGVPTVATRVSGTEEVVTDCPAGRLVPLGDKEQAAAALVDLLSLAPDERRRLGDLGREHVEARFSKEVWRRDVSRFYDIVLGESEISCASA